MIRFGIVILGFIIFLIVYVKWVRYYFFPSEIKKNKGGG